MRRRLPPLNAIRAFDCAARHASLASAAQELCVSPSAISRHISHLEDWLGARLFDRTQQGILLTDAGKRYAASLTVLLDGLEAATRGITEKSDGDDVRIRILPTIAYRWLLPRVIQFQVQHPAVMLQISTSLDPVDLVRGEADLSAVRSAQPPANLLADLLFPEELVAVCSPAYLAQHGGTASLDKATLLSAASRKDDWARWMEGARLPQPRDVSRFDFPYSVLTYEAALEGAGIAIAIKALAQADLDNGRLVMPVDPVVATGLNYYLVCTLQSGSRAGVAAFREWISSQNRPGVPPAATAS